MTIERKSPKWIWACVTRPLPSRPHHSDCYDPGSAATHSIAALFSETYGPTGQAAERFGEENHPQRTSCRGTFDDGDQYVAVVGSVEFSLRLEADRSLREI